MKLKTPINMLYLKDDSEYARLFAEKISCYGYRFDIIDDENECVFRLKQKIYDILVIDRASSGRKGIDTIHNLFAVGTPPPIILISGAGDGATVVEALRLGAADYLIKDEEGKCLDLIPLIIERLFKTRHLTLEKEKTELALRESEKKYQTIFENALEGIFQYSYDRSIISVNPALASMLGYDSIDEMIHGPENYRKHFHFDPEDRERLVKLIERNGFVKGHEIPIHRSDGNVIWVTVNARAVRDEQDAVSYYEGAVQDITERKRVEQTIKMREVELQSIFTAAPIGIGVTERRTFKKVNDRFCNMVGYSRDELIGNSARMIYPDDKEFDYIGVVKNAQFERHGVLLVETRWKRKDGAILDIMLGETPLYLDDLYEEGAIFTALDITKRKTAETALKKSEEKYRNIMETIDEGYFEIDISGNLTYLNGSMARILGGDPEKLEGKHYRDLLDDDMVRRLFPIFNEAFQTGIDKRDVDVWYRDRKDQERFAELSIYLKTDPFKQIVGFSGFARDVTEKKRAKLASRESERKYRDLFENSMDIVFFSSRDGKLMDVNPAGEKLFGYSREELSQINVEILYTSPEKRRMLLEIINNNGFVKDFETAYRNRDGTIRECLMTARAQYDGNGAAIGYQGIIRDISEQKRLQEQLFLSQKMEAIGTLVGGIAHDFNNILATILGYASYLKGKAEKGDTYHEGLGVIEKAAQRASGLTSQLIAYNRRGKIEVVAVNINRIVREVYDIISKTFDRSILIELNLLDAIKTINADKSQINQVVMNLVVNARDAMPEGGTLTINTDVVNYDVDTMNDGFTIRPDEYALLSVIDTGMGMTDEVRKRIFEPYFTTKRERGGSGLGMSVVYGIVKGHGGYITVQSSSGRGARFDLLFPSSEKNERFETISLDRAKGGSETILVVDDEQPILMMLTDLLTHYGYRVLTAESGRAALDIYQNHFDDIDLVILDIIMPGMGGREVMTKMLELKKNARLLMASGYTEENELHRAEENGASGFIGKPFRTTDLLKKIREILGG